ncbi:hypothetical protein CROQUDRAFT_92737 [Cronartium quercuum f. sp. fusiforme G11]|uniref:Uncharacterized protein n=1 Tax=Cronartium quercuum f. sp. fusiforme G11 TaxID=708437 RepID=A0A9P6NLQ0_9BASI|nr:hypothetical protein CROQUDRAFT_92737 [Cronartium quercuum f. sp. fusiforme G11]
MDHYRKGLSDSIWTQVPTYEETVSPRMRSMIVQAWNQTDSEVDVDAWARCSGLSLIHTFAYFRGLCSSRGAEILRSVVERTAPTKHTCGTFPGRTACYSTHKHGADIIVESDPTPFGRTKKMTIFSFGFGPSRLAFDEAIPHSLIPSHFFDHRIFYQAIELHLTPLH